MGDVLLLSGRCFFKKQNNLLRFKSKQNKIQSYPTKRTNGNMTVIEIRIKLSEIGLVGFAKSREVTGRILNATVRRNLSGKYFSKKTCGNSP